MYEQQCSAIESRKNERVKLILFLFPRKWLFLARECVFKNSRSMIRGVDWGAPSMLTFRLSVESINCLSVSRLTGWPVRRASPFRQTKRRIQIHSREYMHTKWNIITVISLDNPIQDNGKMLRLMALLQGMAGQEAKLSLSLFITKATHKCWSLRPSPKVIQNTYRGTHK